MRVSTTSSAASERGAGLPTGRDAALFIPLGLGCVLIACGWVLGLPWGTLGEFEQGAPTSPTPVLAGGLVMAVAFLQLTRTSQILAAVLLLSLMRDFYVTATTEIPTGLFSILGSTQLGAGLILAAVGGILVIAALIADVVTQPAADGSGGPDLTTS